MKSLPVYLCFVISAMAQITFGPTGGQLTPPASNTPPEKRCVIAGHVVNALTGEPVKKAEVRLLSSRAGNNTGTLGSVATMGGQGYSATSEADGTFRMEGVEPGQYSLSGNKSGFLRASYGAKKFNQRGTTINLSPGQQLTDITL